MGGYFINHVLNFVSWEDSYSIYIDIICAYFIENFNAQKIKQILHLKFNSKM